MAGTLVKTLSMQIVADPGNAKAVLDDLNAQGAELAKPHDFVLTADTAGAQAGVDEVTDALGRYQEAVARTADAQAELEAKQAGGEASDDELAAAHDKVTEATLRQLDASIKLGEAQVRESGEARESADVQEESAAKTDAAGDAAEGAGGKFGKFGLLAGAALVGVGYESTKLAVGFQSTMTTIVTQAGVAKSALPGLEQGVLSLAGQVGMSPDSLAEALYHVESSFASVGIKGPQALNLLKIAAQGATTGHADLTDVTNALDSAVVSGIPGVQNYSQAMGALNATVGAGDMTMQDLADALGHGTLANIKLYGSTLSDAGSILATFGDNNLRGAAAGTQLRMSVQALAVQASTAGPYLKELGLQAGELQKYQAIHGTVATVNLLVDKMKEAGITADEQGNVITQLFGKKAGAGIGILVGQVDRLDSKQKVLGEGAKQFGSDAAQAYATPAEKLKQLKSGAEAAGTSLGLVLLPALESTLSPAVKFLNWVDGSKVKMDVFAGVVGVVAGSAVLVKLTGAVKGGVKEFQSLAGMVQTAATKLGIVKKASDDSAAASQKAGGAAKAAGDEQKAAADKAWAASEEDAEKTEAANTGAAESSADKYAWMARQEEEASGEAAATAETDAAETAEANEEAAAESSGSWITAAGEQIAAGATWVAQSAVKVASVVASNVAGAATTLGSWVATGAGMLVQGATWAAVSLGKVALVVGANIAGAASAAVAWIAANAAMTLGITLVVAAVVAAVVLIVKHWHDIAHAFDIVRHDVAAAVDGMVHDVEHDFDEFRHDAAAVAEFVPRELEKGMNDAHRFVTRAAGDLVHDVEHSWDTFRSDTSKVTGDVVHFFERLPGEILGKLEKLPGDMETAGKNVVDGLIRGVENEAKHLLSDVGGLAHDVEHAFTDPLSIFSPSQVMAGHGQNVVLGIAQGVTTATPQLIDTVKVMGRDLEDAGRDAVEGLAAGMRSMEAELAAVVAELGDEADAAIRDKLEISSPSRLMFRHGVNTVLGMVQGIDSAAPQLRTAMGSLTDGIDSAVARATAAASKAAAAAPPGPSGTGGSGAQGGGDTFIFQVPNFSNPTETAQQIQQMLLALKRRNGKVGLGFD